MVQYLIILLDDTSVSYCHYHNNKVEHNLIPINILKEGIKYAMLENLTIQFVYPEYSLPDEYNDIIDTVDHCKIVPSTITDSKLRNEADVVVFSDWTGLQFYPFIHEQSYILRMSKLDFFDKYLFLKDVLSNVSRLNVVLTDIETFVEQDYKKYKEILTSLSSIVEQMFVDGKSPQLNLLTDRMVLSEMNNCNAGENNITLAPDGKFYVCPAFYNLPTINGHERTMEDICNKGYSIGNIHDGLDIKNSQLYKLAYAPICRNCDAYQCKRCIWLNRKTTCEVNIPSHEQCVVAHLERNASRMLLNNIRKHGSFLPEREEIKVIDYLDPFDKGYEW